MSSPPDSLKTPVEESDDRDRPPPEHRSPTQPRRFLGKLWSSRRRSVGEVENGLKQEVQELKLRVHDLELERERLMSSRQKEAEEFMAKCAAEEKERKRAEEGKTIAEEGRRRAEEGRRRAEEGRRRAEEACKLTEDGRKKAEDDWKQAEEGEKKAEEGKRRAEEGWRKAEDNLTDAYAERNQVETELEYYRQSCANVDGRTWKQGKSLQLSRVPVVTVEDEHVKLKKENEELKTNIVSLDREYKACVEKNMAIEKELESLRVIVHRMQDVAQLDASNQTALEMQRRHVGVKKRNASSPPCISEEMWTSKPASLEVQAVLHCNDEEALRYLKNFYGVMETSSQFAAYTSGKQHRDWRCLAEHVGLHEADLQATNCERRLSVIFHEWAKRETVTVAKVHEVLVEAQCTKAAEFLLSSAQCLVQQEQSEHILDLGEGPDQIC